MSTKVILKKSAVTGRVPDSSDLSYGELALNYADGILYYKDTANVVQSISGALDSATIINLIDSDYVQARQVDIYRDSAFVTNIIDSDYVQLRQDYAYSSLTGAPTNVSYFTNDANYLDSALVTSLVDSAYVQARQIIGGGSGGTDSAAVINLIESTIDSIGAIDGVETVGTNAPTDGYVLSYDAANSYWKPAAQTGGSSVLQGAFNTHSSQSYNGDSSTVAFTLPESVTNGDDEVLVTINGIVQHTDTYSVSGTTLTFDSAPVTGDVIEARVNNILAVNVSLRDYQSYVYTPSTSTSAFTGNDDNGNSLTYTLGKVEAYLNGVRLVSGTDYVETSANTLTLNDAIDSGDTLEIVSLAAAAIPEYGIVSKSEDFTTTASGQTVYSFETDVYRTMKFIAQIEHDSDNKYHSEEILLTHNGTSAYMTTYAQVLTDSSLGTFDASISSGTCTITFDPEYTNTSVKLKMIQVDK